MTHTKNITTTLFCAMFFLSMPISAENREGNFDIILSTGYGIPVGGYTNINLQSRTFTSTGALDEVKDHYLNYGKGIQLNGGINYYLIENVAMQILVHYTAGAPSIKVEYDSPTEKFTETYKRNMFGFTVMAVPHFEMFNLLDMYCGVGIGLSFAFLNIENSVNHTYKGNFKTKPGLTFSGLLGSDFPLSDNVALFGEISFDQVSFTIKSSRTTSNTTQTNYIKDSNSESNPTPFKIPGSNLGLRIGIRFALIK